ncbi:MAG: hypothetical protein ABSG99_02665 [Sedimentisphaerales bacterium]
MAIKSVIESWENRTVKETATERTTIRTFTVEFDTNDNPIARPILALKARDPQTGLAVPPYGAQHPFDGYMFVINREVKPAEGAFVYEVTCNYSNDPAGTEQTQDPLIRKPEISWTFVTSDEPIDRALARIEPGTRKIDVPILTSAGEAFDPPPTDEMHDLVLRYVRNVRVFDQLQASRYKGSVNSDMFLGFGPGHAKCAVFDGDKIYDDKYGEYYKKTYEIHFRVVVINGKKYGWVKRTLDQGYWELSDETDEEGNHKYRRALDLDGNPLSGSVPLNGNGKFLFPSEIAAGNVVYLVFETRPKLPFSALNIKV